MFLPLHAGRLQTVNLRGNSKRANMINKHVAFARLDIITRFMARLARTFYCILGKAERGFCVTLINFLPFAPVTPLTLTESLKHQPGPGT